jgi:hypothetical protein
VAHKFGLKWGFNGLVYVYRMDGKVLGEITVTKDYREALRFLGFSVSWYEFGFRTVDDIFDFVVNSKYFTPWMFDLENLNKINRERDKKRKTYTSFLRHVEPMKENGQNAYHYFYPDKKVYLGLIDHHFPRFLREYRLLEKREEHRNKVRSLFNGNLIIQRWPEYANDGKKLGTAMRLFESSFGTRNDFEAWLLDTNELEVVMEAFNRFQSENGFHQYTTPNEGKDS